MKKFVVYYRVSTKKQGDSGLGLEAQQRDIGIYLNQYLNEEYEVIHEVTDVMSGKGEIDARPAFKKAVETAKENGATLLVAKLDRLSRDVETVARLIKMVDFKVACMPNADKFQLHLYAALAEQERDFISQRTKAALEAAKARGVKLGGFRGISEGQKQAYKDIRENTTRPKYEHLRVALTNLSKKALTKTQMAEKLNEMGYVTVERKLPFTHRTVDKAMKYLDI